MARSKVVLMTAGEVFDSLWDSIKEDKATRKPENLSIILDEWADPYESGMSGIVFTEYLIIEKEEEIFCFLNGNGFSSGRGDKTCGNIIDVIKVKRFGFIEELRQKMLNFGWRFLNEALNVIRLLPGNEAIYPDLDKDTTIGRFIVKKDRKVLYKSEIVDFLLKRMEKFLSPSEIVEKKESSKKYKGNNAPDGRD